jgi:Cof subfamily protein (haloacid dehalogenase superfamily)
MTRKAIFMDIDGTLMSRKGVSQRVIDAIQRARAQGHLFFVCTGRSLGHMPKLLLEADYLDGYVMGCGMHCIMGETIVHRERVPQEQVLEVTQYFFDQGREGLYECENTLLSVNANRENFRNFDSVESLAAALEDAPVTKMTIIGPYRQEDAAFLTQWFDTYDMTTYVDVVKSGVTKATGMQHVLDYLGIARENCIGVGDSANDLPMIEFAGLGVAMGNAPEGVKARADVVTESIEDDGVAAMIEKYVIPEVD